jgi:hypothetical protein
MHCEIEGGSLLTSPSQPHVSHLIIVSLTSTHALPLYLTVNSDKQQITQTALKADVLHTDRHSAFAHIAATPAASHETAPTFGIIGFNMSL